MATQSSKGRQTAHNETILLALIGLILTGATIGAVATIELGELVATLLPPIPRWLAEWLVTMTSGEVVEEALGVEPGPAYKIERQAAAAWLAVYLVAAHDRLAAALAEGPEALAAAQVAEQRYFLLHLAAERRRLRAAALVDTTAQLTSDRSTEGLLGWRSVVDAKTTPECRWANGRNFRADQMPVIGWPGAVHLHCRCSAAPPIPGVPLIPAA